MKELFELQKATLAARNRTNDEAIAAVAKAGKIQVGRSVFMPGKATADFFPLSDWLSISDAIKFIEAL